MIRPLNMLSIAQADKKAKITPVHPFNRITDFDLLVRKRELWCKNTFGRQRGTMIGNSVRNRKKFIADGWTDPVISRPPDIAHLSNVIPSNIGMAHFC